MFVIKGFPRPRAIVKNKSYPLPYSAEENAISLLNDERLIECVADKLCIVCGDGVGEIAHALLSNGAYTAESGPFHDRCLTLTMKMCPHIVNNDKWSRVVENTDTILLNVSNWIEGWV